MRTLVKQSSKFRFGHCCSVTLPGLDCLGFRRLCLWGERESSVYLLPTKPFLLLLLSRPDGIGPVCIRLMRRYRASAGECLCSAKALFPVCVGLSLSSLCWTPCLWASASFPMEGISSCRVRLLSGLSALQRFKYDSLINGALIRLLKKNRQKGGTCFQWPC